MINSNIWAFKAQILRDMMNKKNQVDTYDYDEVYNLLSSYPKKKQDIINDVKRVLKNKGNEVTYETAAAFVTRALDYFKDHGKATTISRGMWKKI